MRIAVVTAITGGKDNLREDFCFDGAEFFAYTDNTYSFNWDVREPYNKFIDPVRNAKVHKVLIHRYIPVEADVSIWIDGNICFNVPAPELVEKLLGDGDMWCMTHFVSKDVYEEGVLCHPLDNDPNAIFMQLAKYRQEGYPEHDGMYECNVIIRRNNERMKMFNEKWWAEICCGGRRDQVAFPYALHECRKLFDIDMRTTKGNVREHEWFNYRGHNFY